MSEILLEDACAIASKVAMEMPRLIQPSMTDKTVVILYEAYLDLTAANEVLKGERNKRDSIIKSLLDERKIIYSIAQSPMDDYSDKYVGESVTITRVKDVCYSSRLKSSQITDLTALNAKYRDKLEKIRITWDCACDNMGVCPNCIAREALRLGEGVI